MKILSSVGAKGGSGKSSVALFLAWEFAKTHKMKVAIVDADIQGTCASAKALNPSLPFDVYSVCNKNEIFDIAKRLNKEGYNLLIIDGNPRSINEDPDLIKVIATLSDLNLIISRPTPRDLKAQIKYVEMIKKATHGDIRLLWNFFQKNTVAHRAGIPEGEKMLGLSSLKKKISQRVAYQDIGFSECYIGDLGNNEATHEIKELGKEVKKELYA